MAGKEQQLALQERSEKGKDKSKKLAENSKSFRSGMQTHV